MNVTENAGGCEIAVTSYQQILTTWHPQPTPPSQEYVSGLIVTTFMKSLVSVQKQTN